MNNKIIINKYYRFHIYNNNKIWCSKGHSIYYYDLFQKEYNYYTKVNKLSFINKNKLFNRLFRDGIHNIIFTNNKLMCVVIKNYFLIYEENTIKDIYNIPEGKRPLRNGVTSHNSGIIFSDYSNNRDRFPVNIYYINFNSGLTKKILTLKNIRHIHFIKKNEKNKDQIFIGTGDKDQESSILLYDLKTNKLKYLGSGSQQWRAVSLLQENNNLFWGSDCPYKKNYIYHYNLKSKNPKKIKGIAGPAYYSSKDKKGRLYIATTIEDKREHRAIIYCSENGGIEWDELIEFKKDIWHQKLFGYGIIEFIHNQNNLKKLYINLQGLK